MKNGIMDLLKLFFVGIALPYLLIEHAMNKASMIGNNSKSWVFPLEDLYYQKP